MNYILVAFLILFSLSSYTSNASYRYILDFDGSTVRDGELTDSWRTPWVLVKVDNVSTSAQLSQEILEAPKTIQISYAEYVAYLDRWAKRDGMLADLAPLQLEEDKFLERPSTIYPGLYRVEPSQTFVHYRRSSERDHVVDDYEAAKIRLADQKRNLKDFMGEAFPLLQKALSRSETVGDVTFFTARDQDLQPLIDIWADEGLVENSYGTNRRGKITKPKMVHLQGMSSILQGRSLVEGKVETVRAEARQVSLGHALKTLDYDLENPEVMVEGHTMIIVENDPKNFMAIANLLLELSAEYRLKETKYVLVNAASDKIIASMSRFSEARWWVFQGGFTRFATEKEINNYTSTKTLIHSSSSNSSKSFNSSKKSSNSSKKSSNSSKKSSNGSSSNGARICVEVLKGL